jgi:hypothetical protein
MMKQNIKEMVSSHEITISKHADFWLTFIGLVDQTISKPSTLWQSDVEEGDQ